MNTNPTAAPQTDLRPATAPLETVTAAWSATDEQFFHLVRDLFEPSWLRGASLLLADDS